MMEGVPMFLYTNLQTFCQFNKLKQPEYYQITYETHIIFCYWTISGLFLHMNYISTEFLNIYIRTAALNLYVLFSNSCHISYFLTAI